MAALTGNRRRHKRNPDGMKTGQITGVDSDEFYDGGMVSWSAAASTIVPSSDTASERIAGVCIERKTTSTSNTHKVSFEWGHEEWFATAASSIAAGDEGKNAVIADDQTLSEAADESNDVLAGMITELETIEGTAGAWIVVGVFAATTA